MHTPHVHGHAAYYVLVCNHALPVHIQPRCLSSSSMMELIKYTSKLNFHEKKPPYYGATCSFSISERGDTGVAVVILLVGSSSCLSSNRFMYVVYYRIAGKFGGN